MHFLLLEAFVSLVLVIFLKKFECLLGILIFVLEDVIEDVSLFLAGLRVLYLVEIKVKFVVCGFLGKVPDVNGHGD